MEKIPVFVSCATDLSPAQEESRKIVLYHLEENGLQPRALGRSDYPRQLPLKEVYNIAKHCAGGVILGFEQFRCKSGISKPGSKSERHERTGRSFPTPWNDLEAGILFARKVPLLVFREPQMTGGIFDVGVMDVFTHDMPCSAAEPGVEEVFRKWAMEVRLKYEED